MWQGTPHYAIRKILKKFEGTLTTSIGCPLSSVPSSAICPHVPCLLSCLILSCPPLSPVLCPLFPVPCPLSWSVLSCHVLSCFRVRNSKAKRNACLDSYIIFLGVLSPPRASRNLRFVVLIVSGGSFGFPVCLCVSCIFGFV